MTRVSNPDYLERLKASKTPEELYRNLEGGAAEAEKSSRTYAKTIVAVTACPAGIAHTYMAAEALVKGGEELGVKVYVENREQTAWRTGTRLKCCGTPTRRYLRRTLR